MNDKYLAGVGGVLILTSFAIIVSFFVFQEIEEQVVIQNGAPGFSQLAAIRDEGKNTIDNNTMVEEFKELVGNLSNQVIEKISPVINQAKSET
jgi:hypothetical protein